MSFHTEFCKHYRSMHEHETCKKGVAYADFKGLGFDQRPCFERNGVAPPGCPLAEFMTVEERAEREREMELRFERIGKARQAIVAYLGGPWKKGDMGRGGRIDCPACGAAGSLGFSRSGYNGHIHAHCDTPDCASWME